MDIETQAEAVLRAAEYTTWQWSKGQYPVVCFEDGVLIGFLHVFPSPEVLLKDWEAAETSVLAAHALQLRRAGEKAWNVYSILTSGTEADAGRARAIAKIEENLQRTRKIARAGILSREHVEEVLAPILPLSPAQEPFEDDLENRLRKKVADLPRAAVNTFFSAAAPTDVARMLGDIE